MKFLLILPFIVFNLFALTKSATYPDFKVNSTNLTGYRGDNAACMSQYNDINSYAPANSNVTANATYEQACNDVNPDASKLKILSINLEKSYTADPACTPVDEKADGTYAYKLYFYTHENVQCTYECNNKNTPPDNSGDYTFDEDTCTWSKPCTDSVPDGWLAYPMSDGSCVSYDNLSLSDKEKFSQGGAMVCDVCVAPPYDEHTCLSPNILDTSTIPPRCIPASPCSDNEILDVNGSCVDASIPSDFPSDKGHQSVQKHDYSQADCIPDTVIKTDTSYFKIIGWDDFSKKCVFASFYCNSGLTFDKLTNQCVSPSDETDGLSDGISQELLDSCQSGKWAKRWTYDYCGQELCYIPLDVQDYNLQCNRKYLEYDCTSDYRIKYFKSVSCGERSQDDYQDVNMSIVGSDDGSPDNHLVDANSTVQNSDIASIINSGVSSLHNDLDGLAKTSNEINGNIKSLGGSLNGIDNKLNNISGSLDGISNKLDVLKDTKDLSDDTSSIESMFQSAMDEGFDTYLNMDYTNGLASVSCSAIPTYSMNYHGHQIIFFSQNLLDQWPMSIYRSVIIFMFVFSGVIIAFRSI
jgi:hypothetical protein